MATLAPTEIVSVNPATLEAVGAVARTEPADVPGLVAAAAAAEAGWAAAGAPARARVLAAAGRLVRERADEIAALVRDETAKTGTESLTQDVYSAVDHAVWLARHAPRLLRDERVRLPELHLRTKRAWILREPLGVVAAVTPWNVPFGIPFIQVATALAAGNGVVLKPSEQTPLSAALVESLLVEAGAPSGLVQVAHGGADVGEAVVADEGVAKVFFTGSVAVGRRVAAAAGARGAPVALELGGRDAMVVFADADLERAVEGAVFGSFLAAGQACVSVERILVERAVHAELVRRLRTRAAELEPGEQLAPLISEAQRDAVEQLTGAEPVDRPGWFLRPTVLDGPMPDREAFGPVVAVQAFDGEDEAVELANATAFGLGASIWTRDRERARRVARRIEAGMVWTNDVGYSFATARAPWGGTKASGFGRTGGRHGLEACLRLKLVDWDAGRLRPVWWFPYDAATERSLRALLDVLYGSRSERVAAAWRSRRELAHVVRRSLGR
jgi:acyl-CoA reductase-like NAD-dependent aldehyde dehydrogenase